VEILDPAVGAADRLAVVGEEVEPLVRVDHQLAAVRALERNKISSSLFRLDKKKLNLWSGWITSWLQFVH
jgi:hypothetical protein